MGRPGGSLGAKKQFNPAPPSYRDDVDVDDAVSMHTTASDITYDEATGLPSYTDSEETHQHKTPQPEEVDQYEAIRPPATFSSLRKSGGSYQSRSSSAALGCPTSWRLDARLMDPNALYDYVVNYIRRIPPRQLVRIQGWHWECRRTTQSNGKTSNSKERVQDFDIVFDLKEYLPDPRSGREFNDWSVARVVEDTDKALRGSIFKTVRPAVTPPLSISADVDEEHGDAEQDDHATREEARLRQWCEDFTRSKAVLKTFRVTRNVLDLDENLLVDRLNGLVRSTGYRGQINIELPLSSRYIDIFNPQWINTARTTTWIRWLFYLTFLWLISWPIILTLERTWAIYEIDWRFSRIVEEPAGSSSRTAKRYARGVSEEGWVRQHADLVQALVCEGFAGEATDMDPRVEERRKTRAAQLRMPTLRVGNGGSLGNAVNFVQGGVAAFNILSGRDNGAATGTVGWGADETY